MKIDENAEHFIHWSEDLYGWGDFVGLMLMSIGLVALIAQLVKVTWHAYDYLRIRKEFMQAVIAQRRDNEERLEDKNDEDNHTGWVSC